MTSPGGTSNRQAEITLNANVDPYVKSVTAANDITVKLTDTLKRLDDRITTIAKRAGFAGIAAGGAGLLGAFGSVRQAADLQQAYQALDAQASRTGESMVKVQAGVRTLAADVPVATRNIIAMATQVASLGVQGSANIERFTRVALQLSAATNTAPGQLFTGLTDMTRAMGNSLSSIERYGSSLTDIQHKMGVSATAVLNFAEGIRAVGDKAGVSEANILGLAAAFQKVGADGYAGAQAFNTVINDLVEAVDRGSPRLRAYANLLGLSAQQMKEMVQANPTEAFVRFIEAIAKQGTRASQVLQQFGLDGVRTQRVFAALTSGQADLRQALGLSNEAYRQNSATATAAAAAWDGLNDSVQKLRNSVGQIGDEIGRPFLSAIKPLVEFGSYFARTTAQVTKYLNDAPWPIGDTISVMATKGPALLLLAGAFGVLSVGLLKFLGVWRMASGQLGVNIFRGLFDGVRNQMPRELEGASRSAMTLYQNAYRLGAGGSTVVGGGGVARRSMVGSIAMFPVTRARQIAADATDTLLHPFSPENRDPMKSDPWSAYGMMQRGQIKAGEIRQGFSERALASSDPFIVSLGQRVQSGFGDPDDSAARLRQNRLREVEAARIRARQLQSRVNENLSRAQQVELLSATEVAQFGGRAGFRPTNFANMNRRRRHLQLGRQANFIGDIAAAQAAQQFDAQLSDQETAKLANPFQKLAAKVKTMSAEIVASTGGAVKSTMSGIEGFFRAALDRIVQLAQAARGYIQQVEAQAYGAPIPPAPVFAGTGGAPATPGGSVISSARRSTPRAVSPLGATAEQIAQGVIIAPPGLLRRAQEADPLTGRPGGWSNGSTGASGIWGKMLTSSNKLSEVNDVILTKAREAGRGLASFGGGLLKAGAALLNGPFLLALTVLGPGLYAAVSGWIASNKKITSDLAYTGAEMAQALGRDFITPAERAKQQQNKVPADKDPFGGVERQEAASGDFRKQFANTLSQLAASGDYASKAARLQLEVNRYVQQNNGQPLDDAQQQIIRELIMASGLRQSSLGTLDFTGATPSGFYEQGFHDYATERNVYTKPTRAALSSNAVNDYQANGPASLAYVLEGSAKALGYGDTRRNRIRFGDLTEQIVNDYNKQNPNSQIKGWDSQAAGTGLKGFLNALGAYGEGSPASKLKQSIESLGLTFDQQGHLTASSLERLAKAAGESASAVATSQTSLGRAISGTGLNQIYQQSTGKTDSYVTSLLANTDSATFFSDTQKLLLGVGNQPGMTNNPYSDSYNKTLQERIKLIQQLKTIIGDPSDPAWQTLDNLENTTFSNLGAYNQMNLSPQNQLGASASFVQTLVSQGFNTSSGENSQKFGTYVDGLNQQTQSAVGQLRSYYVQWRDIQRQLRYGEQDHERQMLHMQRDYNVQMAEANYQYFDQQRQALYSYQDQQRQAAYAYSEQQRQAAYGYSEQQRQAAYDRKEQIRSMTYDIAGAYGNPGGMVQAQYTQGASSALVGMDAQVQYLERTKSALENLRSQGVNNDVIRLFKLDDPANFAQAERYVTDFANNPQLVKSFNDSIGKRLSIANALATDPSNTAYTELNRQFAHAAEEAARSYNHAASEASRAYTHSQEEAKRAFDHAADEAARAFAHSQQISHEAYQRSLADFEESYRISVGRTQDDLSRLAEDTMIGLDTLLSWAEASGIKGIQQYAAAIQAAIAAANAAIQSQLLPYNKAAAQGSATDFLHQVVPWLFGSRFPVGTPDPNHPSGQPNSPYPTNGIPVPAGVPGAYPTYGPPSGAMSAGQNWASLFLDKLKTGPLAWLFSGSGGGGNSNPLGLPGVGQLGNTVPGLKNYEGALDQIDKAQKGLNDKIEQAKITLAEYKIAQSNSKAELDRAQKSTAALNQATADSPARLAALIIKLGVSKSALSDGTTESGHFTVAIDKIPKKPTIEFLVLTKAAKDALADMIIYTTAMTHGMINILNNGVLAGWNYVAQNLGLPKNLIISGFTPQGIKGFSTGGYTGDGDKMQPAGVVHAGEFVVTKEKTQQYRPLLEAIHSGTPGYAQGGLVTWPQLDAIRRQLFPGSVLTSAYRPGANDYHGLGEAIDIGWPGNIQSGLMPIASRLAGLYPQSTELIHNPNASIKNGRVVPPGFWGASTWAQHANHVHWAMTPQALAGGTGNTALDAIFNPLAYIQAKVAEATKANPIANPILSRVPEALMGHIGSWITGALSGYMGNVAPPGGGVSGSSVDIVRSWASKYGWGSGPQWDALSQLVQHESGWNSNAQNPTSTAYGLFQFLNSTWAGTGFAKSSDPNVQAQAGLKYISNRYGNPSNAWSFWNSHVPHWYGKGGVFDAPQMIGVGESGPETVIPLDGRGAQFVAQTLKASLQMMDVNELRRGRTSGYASQARSEMHYHHTDASTNFTGSVTVVAQDPNEMARKLKEKARMQALTRPASVRRGS